MVVSLQPAHLMFVLLLERLQQTFQRKTTLTWKLDMERLPPDYWMSILKNLHHKTPIQHCLCILLPLFLLKQLILHALYSDGLRQSMSGISCQRNFLSSFEKIMSKRCPFKMLVVYGLKVSHPMCFSMRQLLELNIKKIHLPSHAKTQTTQKLQLSGSSQLQ